ncbi:MAG: hypothetical protein ACMXYK_01580 [Candidatus Woesearchaeota archaeon]
MKRQLSILMIVSVLFIALASVSFASPEITVRDVTLEAAQERSNSELHGSRDLLDDSRELRYATFTIPVEVKNGTATVTAATVTQSFTYIFGGDLSDDDIYEVTTNLPLEITNATQNVVVRLLVPERLSAIDTSFQTIRHEAQAQLTINDGSSNLQRTSNLRFTVENNLDLRTVDVVVDGVSYRCSVRDSVALDCDRELEELEPGSDFTLELLIRNLFRSNSRIDIEDIEFELRDSRDVEASRNRFSERRLRAGDDFPLNIDFRVDDRVRDGDRFIIEFNAMGVDSNGARHGFEHEFEVRFNIPRAKVEARNLATSPSSVCPGERVSISYIIENLGSDRQSNIRSQIQENALGWDRILDRFELTGRDDNRVDTRSVIESFTVPSNAAPGVYPVRVLVFYQDNLRRDTSALYTVDLRVEDCRATAPSIDDTNGEDDSESDGIVTDETQTTTPSTPSGTVVATSRPQSNGLMTFGLVVLILLLLGVFAALVVLLVRK